MGRASIEAAWRASRVDRPSPPGRSAWWPQLLSVDHNVRGTEDGFSELPKRHIRQIARMAWVSEYPEHAAICHEGSVESAFYVLMDGRARVEQGGRRIARLSAGEFFGEISLLDPGPRTASVISETPVRCLQLVGAGFRAILAREPLLATRVAIGLARRLRRLERPRVE